LAEELMPASFGPVLLAHAHTTSLQRLGYLLEHAYFNLPMADALHQAMDEQGLSPLQVPLRVRGK